MQDSELIARCLEGDTDAFGPLVRRYESHVKALAWNITGNRDDALEASQETFLQAFRHLDRFDKERDFKNWLLGITAKRCIDRLRKQSGFLKLLKRFSSEQPTAKEDVKPVEESPIFNPLWKKLSKQQRVALSLQINENFAAKEIGSILDCSENHARVILYKARQKLKQALDAAGEIFPVKAATKDKTGNKTKNNAKTDTMSEVSP